MPARTVDRRPFIAACNTCNYERPGHVHPCPACRNPEFRVIEIPEPEPTEIEEDAT